MSNPFFSQEEQKVVDEFLENGYVSFPIKEVSILNEVKTSMYEWATEILQDNIYEEDHFFNEAHDLISSAGLNDFRIKLIAKIAQERHIRSSIYSLSQPHIGWLVGNELAMQRNCNLTIHLANDKGSIAPPHSDVWSGNSPYEVVIWIPLVSCFDTKSVYILPRLYSDEVSRNFKNYSHLSANEFYEEIKDHLIFADVPYGHGLIFSHSIIHGSVLNEENETRWSFDVRFKSLLSPYGYKGIGESFLPITVRPVTRIGYEYKKPEVR